MGTLTSATAMSRDCMAGNSMQWFATTFTFDSSYNPTPKNLLFVVISSHQKMIKLVIIFIKHIRLSRCADSHKELISTLYLSRCQILLYIQDRSTSLAIFCRNFFFMTMDYYIQDESIRSRNF